MIRNPTIVLRIDRRGLLAAGLALAVLIVLASFTAGAWAQKAQETYRDKLDIADSQGGVAIATSSDGKYVFVAGSQGVIVSEDYGKTGTWTQTVKLK